MSLKPPGTSWNRTSDRYTDRRSGKIDMSTSSRTAGSRKGKAAGGAAPRASAGGDLLQGGLDGDVFRQQLGDRRVEHALLVALVLRDPQVQHHVRAIQAGPDSARGDFRGGG